ncbi:MAG: diphthamide synthesis protein, partial [Thermoplasmata archaeon]
MDTNLKEYEFNLSEVNEYKKKHRISFVGIQIPEGLRKMQNKLAEQVRNELGCEVIVSAEPSFGACDIADEEFHRLGADILLHFGHSKIPCISHTLLPVFYIEFRSNVSVEKVVRDSINKFSKGEKVGILTTVQHVHKVNEISNMLSNAGLTPIIVKGDERIS